MLCMQDDQLIKCLTALCSQYTEDREKPFEGRKYVAEKSGLSEQYLYQILADKPMANGNKRSIGKSARAKLTKAFPDWLSASQHSTQSAHGSQAESARSLVKKLCELAEHINDIGLKKALVILEDFPRLYPAVGTKRKPKEKAA